MEGQSMRFSGWAFLFIGLALLTWAAGFNIAVESGPSYDRVAVINQGLLSHRLVLAITGATFTACGAIFIGAGAIVAQLATRAQAAPTAQPVALQTAFTPPPPAANDTTPPASQEPSMALILGAIGLSLALVIGIAAWRTTQKPIPSSPPQKTQVAPLDPADWGYKSEP